MVRVPVYEGRQISARPELQQGINVQATPGAFGADIGQGMAQIGRGLDEAAQAVGRLQDFKNELAAKDALTAFERDKMQLDYGPNGYLTTQGRNAADGFKQYTADLEELKKKHGVGLSGGAARAYDGAATVAVTQGMRSGIQHSAQGTKDWAASSSEARMATLQDQALLVAGKPAEVQRQIAAGFMEIGAQADLMGWGKDVVDLKKREFASGVHASVAIALASKPNGATAAMSYLRDNGAQMEAKTRLELETKLKPYADDEAALSVVNEIMGMGRASTDAGTLGASGPTAAKGFLSSRSAHKDRPMDTLGLDDAFAENLAAMIQDAPPGIREGLGLFSAYRTAEQQAAAYANAAPGMAAKPGGSQHEVGRAVDLSYNGKSLRHAPPEVIEWVHSNANKYGLYFPLMNSQRSAFGMGAIPEGRQENWHIEPIGTRGTGAGLLGSTVVPARDGVSARASAPSYDAAMAQINEITDPAVRAAAMKQFNAQMEIRSKAETAAASAAKSEIWGMVAQGVPMSQVPLDLKIAAGREAVTGFMDYEAKAGEIKTDPMLQRSLTLFAATNPVEFASMDLTAPEIINGLSRADLKALTDQQATVLKDERKAREAGLQISSAMSFAKTQLDAVGISSVGLEGKDRQKMAEREAQFQMALADEMRAFAEANNGKQPAQPDIMKMVNRLLLPVVIKTPGTFWDSTDEVMAFEAGKRADGTTVDIVVKYEDIPIDLRRGIALDLERELGRKPSEDEIVQRYEDFTLNVAIPAPKNPIEISAISARPVLKPSEVSLDDRLRGRMQREEFNTKGK